MSRRHLALLLVAALVLIALYARRSQPPSPSEGASANPGANSGGESVAPSPAPSPSPSPSPSPDAVSSSRTPVLHVPSAEDYRREVAKDPEAPPPSVTRFAAELGVKMEGAMQSESDARELMLDLEDCTLARGGQSDIPSIQALCLSAAGKLGKRYPESLGDRAQALNAQAPARIRNLLAILPDNAR